MTSATLPAIRTRGPFRSSKYRLTVRFNQEARFEMRAAGSPSYVDPEGRRFTGWCVDADAVWGVHNEELEEQVRLARRRWMLSLSPRARSEARLAYYRWTCREAAAMGLEVGWY